jgi:hypothetical protein
LPSIDSDSPVRFLHERSVQRPSVLARPASGALRRKRVARVQRLVAQRRVHAVAPPIAARARADFDPRSAGAVRRKPRRRDPDVLDLRAGRQLIDREPIDADVGVVADELLQVSEAARRGHQAAPAI